MKSSYNFIDLNVKDIQQNTGCDLDDWIKVIEILSEREYIDPIVHVVAGVQHVK